MPRAEHHRIDHRLQWRMKIALDRITPPGPAGPRYASGSARALRPPRIAPFLLASATVVLLALAAAATTGSPNPAVWTGDAASTIGSVAHLPEAIPSPQASPAPAPVAPRLAAPPAPKHPPEHKESPMPQPSERPEESPRSQPTLWPSPSGGHWGSSSPEPWRNPYPWGGDH